MATVQITIDSPEVADSKYSEVTMTGTVADALRVCLGKVAENHPGDPIVQAMVDAAYRAARGER